MDSAVYSLGKSLLHSRVAQQHAKGLLEHMVTHQHRRPQQARVRERMPPAPATWTAPPEDSVMSAAMTEVATGERCMHLDAILFTDSCGTLFETPASCTLSPGYAGAFEDEL
jgi:hypothetical protein